MTAPLLVGEHLTKDYPQPREKLFAAPGHSRVLDDVSVTVGADETVAIIGESGSGKSTLVRLLLGLSRPTSGTVAFDGRAVEAGAARDSRWLRRRTGIILQDPYASLNPRMTIGRSIAEPLISLGIDGDRRALVRTILDRVGLLPERADNYPHELSGGQRQRVAIARAIVHGPELVIGDEPLSALDVTIRASILDLLRELRAERRMSLVLVSHDLGLVQHFADRVYVLTGGRLVEQGETARLFRDPQHAYTRKLLAAVPRFPGPAHPPPNHTDPARANHPAPPADQAHNAATTHTTASPQN